ncbi:hypothetical protein P879_01389 [Paragonimus westermani]|uniref:Uncharacterized protein n=1 Tax=Paragonimus westermani TaxID=34504 RepID=A0A8T0DWC1_9TREM|nr:hypothetical protein P879_01389 [Paragonimus westermani]
MAPTALYLVLDTVVNPRSMLLSFVYGTQCLKQLFRPRINKLYTQGQTPVSNVREYFYFIDHHGQLFLDDARIKNFTSCFKDSSFLEFFFARLQQNRTGRYEKEFPYWSPCGRECNFIRCDDRPIVFLDLFRVPSSSAWMLPYGTALTKKLLVPFQPKHLYMCPHSGRIYHPTVDLDARSGMDLDSNDLLVGLICSRLAVRIGDNFQWSNPRTHEDGSAPHSFTWDGSKYKLSDALSGLVHPLN